MLAEDFIFGKHKYSGEILVCLVLSLRYKVLSNLHPSYYSKVCKRYSKFHFQSIVVRVEHLFTQMDLWQQKNVFQQKNKSLFPTMVINLVDFY